MSDYAQYLFDTPREFLVLNATDQPTVLAYDGETFVIPANHEIAKPRTDRPNYPHSGKNSLGEWIPGSLLVRDMTEVRGCPDDDIGNARGIWNAQNALKHCLGIDPVSKQATSKVAKKGVSLLPLSPAPELVDRVRAEARERWKVFRVEQAQQIMSDATELANARRKFGKDAPLPTQEEEEAAMILAQERKARQARIDSLMGSAEPELPEVDEDELVAIARLAAEKAASKAAGEQPGVNRDELVEILMGDPKFNEAIRAKYRMRKLPKREAVK